MRALAAAALLVATGCAATVRVTPAIVVDRGGHAGFQLGFSGSLATGGETGMVSTGLDAGLRRTDGHDGVFFTGGADVYRYTDGDGIGGRAGLRVGAASPGTDVDVGLVLGGYWRIRTGASSRAGSVLRAWLLGVELRCDAVFASSTAELCAIGPSVEAAIPILVDSGGPLYN